MSGSTGKYAVFLTAATVPVPSPYTSTAIAPGVTVTVVFGRHARTGAPMAQEAGRNLFVG